MRVDEEKKMKIYIVAADKPNYNNSVQAVFDSYEKALKFARKHCPHQFDISSKILNEVTNEN